MKTILIVGLGNPGKEYQKTRHNAGFMFVDYFFEKYRDEFGFSPWSENQKLQSLISTGKSGGKKIYLLKPQTFMNLSGSAVSAAKKYFKIALNDLIVVHDEIDLPLGTYRFSQSASSAGHKGAQNTIDVLGTKNFTRLRIGVDNRRNKKIATEKYVLGNLSRSEIHDLQKILENSAKELITKF